MNNDTVLKCAQMAATKQLAFLGYVDDDIQELIAELTAPPVVKTTAKASAAKAPADTEN